MAALSARRPGSEALLDDVVDPWTWPRARGASDREQAIEDIGPYERAAPGQSDAPLVNTNAHYWTALVGIAWTRDVDIDLDDEPVDLDGDGRPDTRVTRHIHVPGGVLGNPALFGLTRTPDDPRGRPGRISASTGVLGLREALGPDGRATAEIGMTCWLCHGSAVASDGEPDPKPILGLAGASFDYGLLLATAAVLDETNAEAAAYRRARGFPSGRSVRARLLLAGPGRQDLTGEFGLDITVPGYHSARYPGTARVRQGTRGVVNPISVPAILAAPGLATQNWSASENADSPWLDRLIALVGKPEPAVLQAFGLPDADRAAARRALLLDLRNLGTLGLQDDSFPGLLWADALYGRAELPPSAMTAIPPMYAAAPVRRTLALEAASLPRPTVDEAAVARGRVLFTERIIGAIANRQVLAHAPPSYAAAKLQAPILAPLDPSQPLEARLPVRCADCHSGAPLERVVPLADNPPPLGRCSHCHFAHEASALTELGERPQADGLVSIRRLTAALAPPAERALCEGCHARHRDFGPLVYSSSRVLPFDADGDGDAQSDPAADRRAGGIGTEPLLAFDVPRPERPFSLEAPLIRDLARAGRVERVRSGVAWVRVAPLTAIRYTAPYLHNGSVPTLAALLEPPARRPARFSLGRAGFVLDTRLPGNENGGHAFGLDLSAADKRDLLAFLQSL